MATENERKYYKAESRADWYTTKPIDVSRISCGALMRIADATEKMAQRHTELITDRDKFERWYKQEHALRKTTEYQLRAAKGQITRLKKKLAAKEQL